MTNAVLINIREGAESIGARYYGAGNYRIVEAAQWRGRVKAAGIEAAMREVCRA